MKKNLLLFAAITTLFSFASAFNTETNIKVQAETSSYLVAPKIAKNDQVIFASLRCSPYAYTGGYTMAKDVDKGYTVKEEAFEGRDITPNSLNTFTVVDGYQSGTLAFKLGDQYLRADNSTLKFKEHEKWNDYYLVDDVYSFSYPLTVGGFQITMDFTVEPIDDDFEIIGSIKWNDPHVNDISAQVLPEDAIMDEGILLFDVTYYLASDGWLDEHVLQNQEIQYKLDGGALLIKDPNYSSTEVVDQEASWTYEYDKITGLSYVQSCLNSKYLYYDSGAEKFKLSSSTIGVDVFFNTSVNTSLHTPTSISFDTDVLDLDPVQDSNWAWTHLEVTANYSGGAFTTLPVGGYDITLPDTSVLGDQTVTVSVLGVSKSFTVTVKEKPAPEIKLKSLSFANYKETYYEGEEFNYDVDITVHYEGKEDHLLTQEEKDERVTILKPNMNNPGYNRAVQVGYWEMINGKKQEIKIGAGANYYVDILKIPYVLDSISASLKDGVVLYDDQIFAKKNVETIATYKADGFDDKKVEVTNFSISSDFDLSKVMPQGSHDFEVTYTENDKTVNDSFTATVQHRPVVESYEIIAADGFVGTEYDVSKNVTVNRVYDSGDKEPAENVIVNINDLNAIKGSKMPKEQTIRVSADGKEVGTKSINLTFAPVTSFSLKYESSKEGADVGDGQQLFIKKVNNEPSLENPDWVDPLSDRSKAYLARFNFESDNTNVATVTEGGYVSYVGKGSAKVKVTPKVGDAEPAFYSVQIGDVEPSSVELNKRAAKIHPGETLLLTATVLPSNAKDKSVTWTSEKPEVATVNEQGMITAIAEGIVTIRVTTNVGGKTDKCVVEVEKYNPTSIALNVTSKDLFAGDEFTLVAQVNPVGKVNQSVTYSSADENIATIDSNGKVKAIGQGSTSITVVSVEDNNVKATCLINVSSKVDVTSITLDRETLSLGVNEYKKLVITVNPSDATNKDVVWSSSDESVAKVDQTGKVTGLKQGEATITVTSVSNPNIKATCKATIGSAPAPKGGCGGSIVAGSVLISYLTFVGIGFIINKRRKHLEEK